MRVLSIDPGTMFTGTAIIDMTSNTPSIVFVETIDGSKLGDYYKDIAYLDSDRDARIHAIAKQIVRLVEVYEPDYIISEAPFFNPTRPQAYASLLQTITTIKCYVRNIRPYVPFETIDPSTVKKTIGVSGTSGDKALMLQGINALGLSYAADIDLHLDEHSVDAIAVGYYRCLSAI